MCRGTAIRTETRPETFGYWRGPTQTPKETEASDGNLGITKGSARSAASKPKVYVYSTPGATRLSTSKRLPRQVCPSRQVSLAGCGSWKWDTSLLSTSAASTTLPETTRRGPAPPLSSECETSGVTDCVDPATYPLVLSHVAPVVGV